MRSLLLLALLLLVPTATAQLPVDTDAVPLASGVDGGPNVWLALAGLVGALGAMYFLIGGVLPGTAGAAQIQKDEAHYEQLKNDLQREMSKEPANADLIREMRQAVNETRDDLLRTKAWQYTVGTVVFAVTGAGLAGFFAQDLVQAVGIGAGWTGIFGSFGIKKSAQVANAEKDRLIEELHRVVRDAQSGGSVNVPVGGAPSLDRRVEQVKRMTLR